MEQLLIQLLSHGPIGLVAAIALWFAWSKDKEIKRLYHRMISKEEKRAEWMSKLFSEVNQTVRVVGMLHDKGEDEED